MSCWVAPEATSYMREREKESGVRERERDKERERNKCKRVEKREKEICVSERERSLKDLEEKNFGNKQLVIQRAYSVTHFSFSSFN